MRTGIKLTRADIDEMSRSTADTIAREVRDKGLSEFFSVVARLEEWLAEQIEAYGRAGGKIPEAGTPGVSVWLGRQARSIHVGEACVWDSECDSSDALTFEACRDAYVTNIREAYGLATVRA